MLVALLLVRGLPGAGKSEFGGSVLTGRNVMRFSADDFMVDAEGKYSFDPKRLGEVHQRCQDATRQRLIFGDSVIVANTFCEAWEVEPYRRIAEATGARLIIVSLFDGGCSDEVLAARNIHGAPIETIAAMRQRFDHTLTGDPRAPWERKATDQWLAS